MLRHVIKYTLITVAWKRYKKEILAMLSLLVYFWLVSKLHHDFMLYAEIKGDNAYVGLSFFVKWLLFLLGLFTFSVCVFRKSRSKPHQTSTPVSPDAPTPETPDPFDTIRSKSSLKSRSDQIIEQYPDKAHVKKDS